LKVKFEDEVLAKLTRLNKLTPSRKPFQLVREVT